MNSLFNQILNIIVPLLIGLAIGFIFFAVLWLTVRKLVATEISGAGMLLSFVVRTFLAVGGFYLVLTTGFGPSWERAAACLVGFVCARIFTAHLITTSLKEGGVHAT